MVDKFWDISFDAPLVHSWARNLFKVVDIDPETNFKELPVRSWYGKRGDTLKTNDSLWMWGKTRIFFESV